MTLPKNHKWNSKKWFRGIRRTLAATMAFWWSTVPRVLWLIECLKNHERNHSVRIPMGMWSFSECDVEIQSRLWMRVTGKSECERPPPQFSFWKEVFLHQCPLYTERDCSLERKWCVLFLQLCPLYKERNCIKLKRKKC